MEVRLSVRGDENIFALVTDNFVIKENVTQEEIFETLGNNCEPEDSNFHIEVWNNGQWQRVL